MINFYHILLFVNYQSQEFYLRIPIRTPGELKCGKGEGRGSAGEELRSCPVTASLDCREEPAGYSGWEQKQMGLMLCPSWFCPFLSVCFYVFLLNSAHDSVFPHPSEAQSLVTTQSLLLSGFRWLHWPRPKAKIKVSDGVSPSWSHQQLKCSVWIYCNMDVHRLNEKQFQQMLS